MSCKVVSRMGFFDQELLFRGKNDMVKTSQKLQKNEQLLLLVLIKNNSLIISPKVFFLFNRENDKTDLDIIRENHRFLWREEDEVDMNW